MDSSIEEKRATLLTSLKEGTAKDQLPPGFSLYAPNESAILTDEAPARARVRDDLRNEWLDMPQNFADGALPCYSPGEVLEATTLLAWKIYEARRRAGLPTTLEQQQEEADCEWDCKMSCAIRVADAQQDRQFAPPLVYFHKLTGFETAAASEVVALTDCRAKVIKLAAKRFSDETPDAVDLLEIEFSRSWRVIPERHAVADEKDAGTDGAAVAAVFLHVPTALSTESPQEVADVLAAWVGLLKKATGEELAEIEVLKWTANPAVAVSSTTPTTSDGHLAATAEDRFAHRPCDATRKLVPRFFCEATGCMVKRPETVLECVRRHIAAIASFDVLFPGEETPDQALLERNLERFDISVKKAKGARLRYEFHQMEQKRRAREAVCGNGSQHGVDQD
ncbi:unnamed protein product, partial [Amoebophrya sp. A120]